LFITSTEVITPESLIFGDNSATIPSGPNGKESLVWVSKIVISGGAAWLNPDPPFITIISFNCCKGAVLIPN